MKRDSNAAMGLLCAAIAAVTGVVAAIGIFARGDGSHVPATSARGVEFDMATNGVYAYNAQRVVAEGVGWDVFTLVVAVPALLVAGYFVARGSFPGRLFAMGVLGYFLYQYLEYAVTWAFGPLFLAFVVIYATSLVSIVGIGAGVAREGIAGRFGNDFPRRSWAALSVAMSALLIVMWLGRIAAGLSGDLAGAGLASETTLTIQALDLGLVVPACLASAVLAWRRSQAGYAFATAFSVTFLGMAAAIASMLLSAWAVEGTLEVVPIAIFAIAAISGGVIAIRAYRGIGRPSEPSWGEARAASSASHSNPERRLNAAGSQS